MKMLTVLVGFMVMLWAGCVTPSGNPDIRYVSDLPAEMTFRGFLVTRPVDPSWHAYRNELSPIVATYRKETGSNNHTFYCQIQLLKLPASVNSFESFKHAIEQDFQSSERSKMTSTRFWVEEKLGANAVAFDVEYNDFGSISEGREPLRTYYKGFALMHPSITDAYIFASMSERGPEAVIAERRFEAAGEALLAQVKLLNR